MIDANQGYSCTVIHARGGHQSNHASSPRNGSIRGDAGYWESNCELPDRAGPSGISLYCAQDLCSSLSGKRGGMYWKVDRAARIAEKLEIAKSGTNKSGTDSGIIDSLDFDLKTRALLISLIFMSMLSWILVKDCLRFTAAWETRMAERVVILIFFTNERGISKNGDYSSNS